MKLIFRILIFLSFFTSSGDIIFNPQFFGLSFRYTYFINIVLFLTLLSIQRNLKIKIIGAWALVFWAFGEFIFLYNVPEYAIVKNVGYFIWFLWNILYTITLTYLSDISYFRDKLIKDYLLSFLLVALFGFIQFILYPFGIDLLVMQKWPTLGLARINGFSFEPSYFGTYLLIGWSILFHLFVQRQYVFNKNLQTFFLIFTSLVIILSSSRMTIIVLMLAVFVHLAKGLLTELYFGRVKYWKFFVLVIGVTSIGTAIVYFSFHHSALIELLQGTGIGGTASHSSSERSTQMIETWKAFKNSPFFGHSFGGVDIMTSLVHNNGDLNLVRSSDYTGMNIFLEQLVSAGLLFYPFFIIYLYLTFKKCIELKKTLINANYKLEAAIISSLITALLFELIILCLNQGILRSYLWILIAVLNFYYFSYKNLIANEK